MNNNPLKCGGPAFPHSFVVQPGNIDPISQQKHTAPVEHIFGGMSLRDYFADGAMRALCSNPDAVEHLDFKIRAKWAYKQADAMLKAREGGAA